MGSQEVEGTTERDISYVKKSKKFGVRNYDLEDLTQSGGGDNGTEIKR